ncbi:MAG: hypothetical protein JNJ61_28575 [Anaerolineae bacterium]|nr:hypothetical protein [Anaerolineae bacterium]
MFRLMRLALVVILLFHGVGHVIGLAAAWTSVPVGITDAPWIFSADYTIQSNVGRLFGLGWLLSLLLFLAALYRLVIREPDWRGFALLAAGLSLIVIVPWWNAMPVVSLVGAIVVDLVLFVVLLPPWGRQLAEDLADEGADYTFSRSSR